MTATQVLLIHMKHTPAYCHQCASGGKCLFVNLHWRRKREERQKEAHKNKVKKKCLLYTQVEANVLHAYMRTNQDQDDQDQDEP